MIRSRVNICLHLVWETHRRQPWITPEIERFVAQIVHEEVARMDCKILALGGTLTHQHLLVAVTPKISVSKLINNVRDTSFNRVRQRFQPPVERGWEECYGVESISCDKVREVIDYIREQKMRHAAGHLWPHLELTSDLITGPEDVEDLEEPTK